MAEKFNTLVDMFQRSTDRYRDQPLFGEKRGGEYRWTSFYEVRQRVDNFRAALAARGITRGDTVACIADNSIGWAVAAHACFGLGAGFVAMYEAQKPSEWAYIINDCKAKAVVLTKSSERKVLEQFNGVKAEVPTIEHVICIEGAGEGAEGMPELEAEGKGAPVDPIEPDPSDLAVLIYTSGTTGKPKGVQLSHSNIVSNINAVHEVFPMAPGDRSLSFLPWAHSFGSTVELHCLTSVGASMGIAENVTTIIENLAEVKPTLLFSVPRIFNKIHAGVEAKMKASSPVIRWLFEKGMTGTTKLKKGESLGLIDGILTSIANKVVFGKIRARFGGRLKYAFSGGAAISKEVAEFIDNLGIMVYEGYGLSETSPIATANYPNNRKIGSVGKAIPGVKIEIDKSVVEDKESPDGEIIVHGPNVMQGYLNLPDATKEVMRDDGGFRTGDLGRLDSDGYLYITGRVKEQYKLENGKYVVPAPLEEKLKLSAFIDQVMVYGFNKPFNVAVIVPSKDELTKWAAANGLGGKSYDDLVRDPKVSELIQREIDDRGEEFKNYERVRKCALVAEEFTPENEMLTPTLKLKRRNVLKQYQGLIDDLYKGAS